MKHGRYVIVLMALVVFGCGQPQRRLKVTYDSNPPGGTLYKQNGELWGPCPKVLYYDLDEGSLAAGQLKAKGLIVRWPSGPESRSDDLIAFPLDGKDHQFTFVQPGQGRTDQGKTDPSDTETAAPTKVEFVSAPGLHEERDEQVVASAETIKPTEPLHDPGLREEPDAMPQTPDETIRPAESASEPARKQQDTAQTKSEESPGIREEPAGNEVQIATAPRGVDSGEGIIEKPADADAAATASVPTTASTAPNSAPGADRLPAVPSTNVGTIVKLPEQPGKESIQVKIETRTVDFGNGVMMDFALIPAGEFTMETRPGAAESDPNQNRTQIVRITKPFYMGVYEVTQEQFEKVMQRNPSSYRGPKRPVERVSWHGAQRFCEELSRTGKSLCRLPTEAEWEYACRAGTITPYYWGDDFDSRYAWTLADRASGTHNVGTRLPNAWGLYDMSGNVWEWCSDWYSERDTSAGELIDPNGPSSGNFRVLRGGSWGHSQQSCQSSYRNWHTPNHRYDDCGFRVVLELDQPSKPTQNEDLPANQ